MHERAPMRALSEIGLLAAGLALSACGSSEPPQDQHVIGYAPSFRCNAHMYKLGEVSVNVVELDSRHQQHQPEAQRIQVQLPDKKPVSKPAHHNTAHFAIPKDYSQIFVKAKTKSHLVACSTITPSHY